MLNEWHHGQRFHASTLFQRAAFAICQADGPMIEGRELVTRRFGYWPEFADARVRFLRLHDSGCIEIGVHYIDADQAIKANIDLRFTGASEIQLMDFRSQNVLDALRITPGNPHRVDIESCCGVYGDFTCTRISVINISA